MYFVMHLEIMAKYLYAIVYVKLIYIFNLKYYQVFMWMSVFFLLFYDTLTSPFLNKDAWCITSWSNGSQSVYRPQTSTCRTYMHIICVLQFAPGCQSISLINVQMFKVDERISWSFFCTRGHVNVTKYINTPIKMWPTFSYTLSDAVDFMCLLTTL